MLVLLSLYVMLSILLSILVCEAASLFCALLLLLCFIVIIDAITDYLFHDPRRPLHTFVLLLTRSARSVHSCEVVGLARR